MQKKVKYNYCYLVLGTHNSYICDQFLKHFWTFAQCQSNYLAKISKCFTKKGVQQRVKFMWLKQGLQFFCGHCTDYVTSIWGYGLWRSSDAFLWTHKRVLKNDGVGLCLGNDGVGLCLGNDGVGLCLGKILHHSLTIRIINQIIIRVGPHLS